ncbi:protein BCAP-like isoform X3 [Stegostoma tigrinum]|uniref:protein BCAP-like isoform X3 n=1 Tax=Stegostoma tigrinum TaxID=3053191 RepID=UPI002870009E|nr:protein BCAP-like isoform X3 [Stegostoma tigrinum]
MKSRSSSPPNYAHLKKSAPVHVHLQKPKLLPSVVELSRVQKRNRSTPSTRANRTVKGKAKGCREPHTSTFSQSYKQEFSGYAANIESKEEPNASNWISEDCETDAQELTQSTNKNRTSQESFEKFQKELDWIGLEKESLAKENMLLTALKEAEMTSISAAEQVARLWNSVAELMQVNQLPASGFSGFTEENNMFLEKLENFKIATQKLQYLLREQWNSEPCMDCTNSQVEVLTQKLTRCETENIHLKRRLQDVEKNAKEALELCQMEKVNFCFVKQLSKSVEATQARLQGQLGNKEVRNNRMSRQIMKFEGTVTGQKLQITHLKSQLAALEEQLAVDKEILKRATRAQRKRAERFETAVEDLNSQVKEKDLKLLEVRRDIDSWKKQYDLAFDERTQLETEKISLSHRVAGLEEQLQRDTERSRSTSHELLDKLHNSNLEISNLKLENVQLKADDQNFKLKSPSEIVESLSEEKQKLQMTIEVLSWKLKEGNLHNEELTKTIAQQEEAFLRSKSQLEERTRESSALSQQLEAALHDVTEKVRKVKDQTETQEHALQSKLHSLGLELNRKTKELKQLQWNENNAERSHETHLQELRLSLEQSENENQSIQNYMRFLKLCYTIMFGDDTITDFNGEPALR